MEPASRTERGAQRARGLGCAFAAMLAVCAVVGLSATPAAACSCAASDDFDAFEAADVVFVGELVDYEGPPRAPVMSSSDPAIWTFAVDEVFKGEATETQEVVSASSGASCGLELPHEGTFLVFASHDTGTMATRTGQLHAGLCGGTQQGIAPAAFAELGRPPKPLTTGTAASATDDAADPATRLPDAIGAGAVVIAGAGLAFVVHRRRRTPS